MVVVVCGPKRERPRGHPQDGMVREAEGEHAGVSEGNIPGTRRRRARVEKRVRAAHYARDTSRGPPREESAGGHARRDGAREETPRGRGKTGRERKIIERRGRKSVRARRRGAGGEEGERNPWKSRGERFVAVTDPLAVARARQSTFSARESRRRRRRRRASQHRAIVARSASTCRAAGDQRVRRKREGEGEGERGRNEDGNARRVREKRREILVQEETRKGGDP